MNTPPPNLPHSIHDLPPSPTKTNSRMPEPGTLRKLLSIAAFFMAFATVMALLLIYMDNTAMRHHQFRVNMSQEYELLGVSQDDPQLVMYIRVVQLKQAVERHHHPLPSVNLTPTKEVEVILSLHNQKKSGFFVEAGSYGDGKTSTTELLERKFGWHGLLLQPDPQHYFSLLRHNRANSQAVHGCLSPNPYPKEVPYHQEERDGVKINSIHSNSLIDDPDFFNTRIKCYPLYSLLLAMNTTHVDYFSLESGGTELQVLETIPFDRVEIEVISIHLFTTDIEKDTIERFLNKKNYTFYESFNNTYVYYLNSVENKPIGASL